jgi:hypothetical protein
MHWPLIAMIALTCCLANATTAQAARFVRVQIILEGRVILEGNASDDGSRDADQLWDALKSVEFKPTAEFHKLNVDADVQETVLKSTSPAGELVNLKIEVAYGGTAITNELRIKRVPVDDQGREWQLDSNDVTRLFDSRMISRSEAANLIDQKRKQ